MSGSESEHFPIQEVNKFQEALKKSPLLYSFLEPHEDLSSWEEAVRKCTRPIQSKFDTRLSQGWVISLPLIFNKGFIDGIFSSDYLYGAEHKRDNLKLLGMDLLFIGFDVETDSLQDVFQPVVNKVKTLPYINPYMRERSEIDDYVRLAISVGPEVREHYPDSEYKLPTSEAIGWTPGAWKSVLDTIPMDDILGERP